MADEDLKQLIRDFGGAGGALRRTLRADINDDTNFRKRQVTVAEKTYRYETKGGFPRVLVDVEPDDPPELCPAYLSGIVVNGWNAEKVDGTKLMHAFFPAENYKPALGRDWRLVKVKYKGVESGDVWRHTFAKPFMGPEDMVTAPEPPDGFVRYTDSPQVAYIKPGLYSGVMRSVVQYMLGARQRVNFDYHFLRTHGIMTIGTTPWVVEISQQYGVLAAKLMTCRGRKDPHNPLGYTPLGSLLPCKAEKLSALVSSGKVIQLLTAGQLSTFYSNSSFFGECGWAFSYSGREAQNTCWSWPDTYKRAHRYKITIADDGKKPVSAALTLEDSGYMIGDTGGSSQVDAFSQVRVPNYGLVGNVTFDMTPEGYYSHPFDSLCPIYVYYDGNEPQYVNWVNETWRTGVFPDIPPWSEFNPDEPNSYTVEEYMFLAQNPGQAAKYHQITSPAHPSASKCYQGVTYVAKWARYFNNGFAQHWVVSQNGGTSNNQAVRFTNIDIFTRQYSSHAKMVRHTLTIPLFEREAVHHMRMAIDDKDGDPVSIAPYTVYHYERFGAPLYYFGQDWDDALGQPTLPFRWKFTGNWWSNTPTGAAGYCLVSDGHIVSGAGIPSSLWLTDFTGNSATEPWVDVIVNNTRVEYPANEYTTQQDIRFRASGNVTKVFALEGAAVNDWFRLVPTVLGWFSRIFAARSADLSQWVGVISKQEFTGDFASDFDARMKSYPAVLSTNIPHLTFLGSAEN